MSGGGSAGAVALAGFSGSVTAGSDGVVLSEGDINASVSAGKDVFVLAHGDVTGGYSAGRDAAVVTYGDFNAGVSAARDVGYVLAGGDISGAISADRSIGQHHNFLNTFTAATGDAVFAYGDISASISALNISGSSGGGMIAGVGAGGPIAGTITAAGNLGGVRSGDDITATITSANAATLSPFETALQSLTAPSLPPSIAPGLLSDVAAALVSLNTDKADLLASLATSLSDAATSRTDTLSDFATATADHATSVTNLIATSASSVAADITALETAFKADQQAATNALQQAVDAINGLFAGVESDFKARRLANVKAFSEANAAKAKQQSDGAAAVTANNQKATDAASQLIAAKGEWRERIEEQTKERALALNSQHFEFDTSYDWINEQWMNGNTELAIVAAFTAAGEAVPFLPSPLAAIQSANDMYDRGSTIWGNARDADASWFGAAYQTAGVLAADAVGVTGVFKGVTGEDPITLQKLSTAERVMEGTFGGLQLVATAVGVKAGISNLRNLKKCGCFVGDTQVQTFDDAGVSGYWLLGAAGIVVTGAAALAVEERRRVKALQAAKAAPPWELAPDPDELDHLWMMPSDDGNRRDADSSELDVLCDLLFNSSPKTGGSHVE